MCNQKLSIQHEIRGKIPVQCRRCSECRKAKQRDYIGRLLAEEKGSVETWFVTFTYGGGYDNDEAYLLKYKTLQDCFKNMRKGRRAYRGGPWQHEPLKFKYAAVGEYGTEGQRAHFHALIFWKTKPPPIPMNENFDYWAWPHGHLYAEYPRSNKGCAVYLMKYMGKDDTELKVSNCLGEHYMIEYARDRARAKLGLFQEGNHFTIPGVERRDGKLFEHPVDQHTSVYHKMIREYVLLWHELNGHRRVPYTPHVAQWIAEERDKIDQRDKELKAILIAHHGRPLDYDDPVERLVLTFGDIICDIGFYTIHLIVTYKGTEIWRKVLPRKTAGPPKQLENQPEKLLVYAKERISAQAPPRVRKHIENEG